MAFPVNDYILTDVLHFVKILVLTFFIFNRINIIIVILFLCVYLNVSISIPLKNELKFFVPNIQLIQYLFSVLKMNGNFLSIYFIFCVFNYFSCIPDIVIFHN